MSRMLVLYGTTDGHTAKVAQAVAGTLQAEGCTVTVVDAATDTKDLTPESYDGVIVAASVQMGHFQRTVERWVRTHARALDAKPTAFLSVCLGILEPNPKTRLELEAIVRKFLDATKWHPTRRCFVAGATPFTRYGFFKRWIIRRIVAKNGGDTDISRDIEYTDWNALREFTRTFAALAIPGSSMLGPAGSWV